MKTVFPKPDRSDYQPNFTKSPDNDQLDVGWNEGVLSDGRPYRIECWAQDQLTNVTVFLSSLGLEDASPQQLIDLLGNDRVVWFKPRSQPSASTAIIADAAGSAMWSINIVIGEADEPARADSVPLLPYQRTQHVGVH